MMELTHQFDEFGKAVLLSDADIPWASKKTKLEVASQCRGCAACTDPLVLTEECKHAFCQSCWNSYLLKAIHELNDNFIIPCPASGCQFFVDERIIEEMTDFQTYSMYYRKLLARLVFLFWLSLSKFIITLDKELF